MRHIFAFFLVMSFGVLSSESRAQFPVTDFFDQPTERIDTVRVIGLRRECQWVAKFSPLSLIDFESTYRFDLERVLGGRHSLQAGLGYGNDYSRLFRSSGTNDSDKEVWRAQMEYRIYTKRDQPANRWRLLRTVTQKPLGSYWAIEVFYKQVNDTFDGTLGRGCEDGTCQFFQSYTARAMRYVVGSHLKLGQQASIRLSETNNRLLIDYYVGVGLRWRWFEQVGIPDYEDARPLTFNATADPTSIIGGEKGRFPSLAFGIQIGYAF